MMFIYRRAPDWSEEKNCFFVVRLGFLAFGSIFFCHIKFRDTELRNEKKKKEKLPEAREESDDNIQFQFGSTVPAM